MGDFVDLGNVLKSFIIATMTMKYKICFRFLDVYDKTKCAKFITTCVYLHNICMDTSDDWSSHEAYTSNSISNDKDTCSDVIILKMLQKQKRCNMSIF